MSIDMLFTNPAGLPRTVRGAMPYWVEALTPRETWGHDHGSTALVCGQTWDGAAQWIRYMMGEVKVQPLSSQDRRPILVRHIPEKLRYTDVGDGSDRRVQWCTGLSQTEQGGNPAEVGEDPADSEEVFAQAGTNWPATAWCKYSTVWETTPYFVRTQDEIIDMEIASGASASARELSRYIVRTRKTYSKEQPVPNMTHAGGFYVITDPAVAVASRQSIGQVGFRVVSMADVTYRWVRVPVGWPPHPGWLITDLNKPWPPPISPVISDGLVVTARPTRDTFIGTINSTFFDCTDPEGYGWFPGELLYVGYDDSRKYYDAAGDRVMDVDFHFKYKEGGWNYFLDAYGNWKEVSARVVAGDELHGTTAGRRPYETNDFNDLFRWSDV